MLPLRAKLLIAGPRFLPVKPSTHVAQVTVVTVVVALLLMLLLLLLQLPLLLHTTDQGVATYRHGQLFGGSLADAWEWHL